jgi:membrane protein
MNLKSLRNFLQWARGHTPRWVAIPGYAAYDLLIDNGFAWSAAIAFYGILSIFPLALGVISIATWFIDPQWAVQEASHILGDLMPQADTIRNILGKAVAARSQIGLLSLVFLLWAGSRVFSILISALNIACDVDETYSFFQSLGVELGMVLSIGLLFLVALLSSLLVPVVGYVFSPVPNGKAVALTLIGWILPALLLTGGLFCLYKFVSRHRCNWQSSLLGAGIATLLTLGARPLFHAYVGRLASYNNHIYGWLTIGIVILLWAQILALITLYGGELASRVQLMVYDGVSAKEVSRRHRARSSGHSHRKKNM